MKVNHGITDTGKLKTIEIDKYEPIPDKPGRCRLVGRASPREVLEQLKDHLRYVGMFPDEGYFLTMADEEIIPENWTDFACNVGFSGIGGIVIDISLNTSDGSQRFIAGRTSNEDMESFLEMSRIAAECNLMLNGNGSLVELPQDIAEYFEYMSENKDKEEYDEMEM